MSSFSTLLNMRNNNILNFSYLVSYYSVHVYVIKIHIFTNKVIVVVEKPGRRRETVLLQDLTVPSNKKRALKISTYNVTNPGIFGYLSLEKGQNTCWW